MTDASFVAAGYAVLIEDDPYQNLPSPRKSYASVAEASKTFTAAQIKMLIFDKEVLAIYFAFNELGHIFFYYVIQFNFVIAHIPGDQNKAAEHPSRFEADPKEKLVMKTKETL